MNDRPGIMMASAVETYLRRYGVVPGQRVTLFANNDGARAAARDLMAAGVQVAVDPGSAVPMIGASGAISGILGAYLILFPTAWVWSLVPWIVPILPVPAVV